MLVINLNKRVTMYVLVLTVVVCLIAGSASQEVHFGRCPKVTTVPNLDVNRYLGDWYEITKFYFRIEEGEKCVRANYSLKADGHIKVLNRAIKADGSPDEAIGDAEIPDPNVKSKLAVQFAPGTPRGNYWIVDTDYDSYSLVWSCTDLFVVNFDIAWILSRKRTLDDSTVTMLKQKLAGFGINVDGFRVTDQSNCPQ